MEFAYRQRYVQILIKALKENVEKTSSLQLDEMTITHFGIKIEESCISKVYKTESYTRAITRARVNIERCTANKTLFPMIAKAMLDETTQPVERNSAENNNENESNASSAHTTANHQPATQNYTVDNDVIVIDSSDSEDEIGATIQNAIEGEILFTVQTTPLTGNSSYSYHSTVNPTEDSTKTI